MSITLQCACGSAFFYTFDEEPDPDWEDHHGGWIHRLAPRVCTSQLNDITSADEPVDAGPPSYTEEFQFSEQLLENLRDHHGNVWVYNEVPTTDVVPPMGTASEPQGTASAPMFTWSHDDPNSPTYQFGPYGRQFGLPKIEDPMEDPPDEITVNGVRYQRSGTVAPEQRTIVDVALSVDELADRIVALEARINYLER